MKNNNQFSISRKLLTFLIIFSFLAPMMISLDVVFGQKQNNTGLTQLASTVEINQTSEWDDNYGVIYDLVVEGNYMYIALGPDGLAIYEITGMNAQFLLHWDYFQCNHLYNVGNNLYMSNSTGIYILDVTDKLNPAIICSWIGASSMVYDIYSTGDFVFFTDFNGFKVLNVTDLANPTQIDSYLEQGLREFHVSNNIAYILDNNNAFIRLQNITIPDNLGALSSIAFTGPSDIFVFENFLYLANTDLVTIYNITLPSSPVSLFNYNFNNTGTNFITANGNYLFIEEGNGYAVVDVSNKSDILYYSENRETIPLTNVYVSNDVLFCYNSHSLEIYDVTNPEDNSLEWFDNIFGSTSDLFLDDTILYAADYSTLEILDVSDPANPSELGTYFDNDAEIKYVAVNGHYAYIIENTIGLKIIDIADPANPIEMGNVTFMQTVSDIAITDEYAFLAFGPEGFAVIDIYYPDYPQMALIYDDIVDIASLAIMDNYLYITAEEYFHILDITNPYNPEIIGNWTRNNAYYYNIALDEDYAYVMCQEGVDIIDISTPTEPTKVGQFFTYKNPEILTVNGQYIYLLDAFEGFDIIDATNIAHPLKIGTSEEISGAQAIWAKDGYIYVGAGLHGTIIYGTEPLLTIKSAMNPLVYIGGLVFFSILGLIIRKRKN